MNMTNPYSTEDKVNASAQEVEDFIRGYFKYNDSNTRITTTIQDYDHCKERWLGFWYYLFTGNVLWGSALILEYPTYTAFNVIVNYKPGGLPELCSNQFEYDQEKHRYQKTVDELHDKILKNFKQDREQPKTEKVTAAFRKEAMMWRELRVMIKQRVRPSAGACRAELIKQPAYKNLKRPPSRQYVENVLKRGAAGDYDDFLKSL